MKKLLSISLLTALLFVVSPLALAKTGSGGQPAPTPVVAPTPEPAPTPAPTPEPVKETPKSTGSETTGTISTNPAPAPVNPPTPTPVVTPTTTPAVTTPVAPAVTIPKTAPAPKVTTVPVVPEKKHCGTEKNIRERVACRFNADADMINLEYSTAYFPEGCRRGSSEWQEDCKTRYKKIGPCWNYSQTAKEYDGEKVVSCLKDKLVLPANLDPVAKHCEGKAATCSDEYKKTVYHLIVARFYDAEQRAELLLADGKISKVQAIDFISFISQAKVDFYDAKTKDERVSVIKKVISEWQKLVKLAS